MNTNDYYGHYKAFVKALSEYPDLTLQQYCKEQDVIWRRLYDWMHRNKISLKRLYATYRQGCASVETRHEQIVQFCELLPTQSRYDNAAQMHFVYSMPYNRIASFLNENGFNIGRGTIGSLVAKAPGTFERRVARQQQSICRL